VPLYSYKAIDAGGKSVLGRIDAVNLFDLEQRLSRMELDLVAGAPASDISRFFGGGKISRQDLINFCFHLEQLATAGVPLVEGLGDLRDSTENPRFREIVSGLIESIQGGQSLSQALADYPNVFSKVFVSLVRSGEQTGKLDVPLANVTYFYNREVNEGVGKAQAALQPILTLILGLVLLWVMLAVLGPVYDTISKMKF